MYSFNFYRTPKPLLSLLLFLFCFQAYTQRDFAKHTGAEKSRGIALVLANQNYETGKLRNVVDFGKTMKQTLYSSGFDVMSGYDMGKKDMLRLISNFGKEMKAYDFALIYYNGHGIQFDDEDYLMPTSASVAEDNPTLMKEANIGLLSVLELTTIKKEGKQMPIPRVIVYDACRNNPFWKNLYSTYKSTTGIGLKKAELGVNTLTVYSTFENTRVSSNNPFTALFSTNLSKGGCISDIINRTAAEVYSLNQKQIVEPKGVLLEGEVCIVDQKVVMRDAFSAGPVIGISKAANSAIAKKKTPLQKADAYYDANDFIDALYWYKESAKSDNPQALFKVGYMYRWGMGLNRDMNESAEWFEKAAALGQADAMLELGISYRFMGLGTAYDPVKSYEWLTKAAEAGIVEAEYELGVNYAIGIGVPKDPANAAYWYRKAARSGNILAMANLAGLYRDGSGLTQNYGQAFNWYKKSADAGHEWGLNGLGTLYENGWGVKQNFSKARELYEQASAKGFSESQYRLGMMYYEGKGGPVDLKTALYWLKISCDNHSLDGCQQLKDM